MRMRRLLCAAVACAALLGAAGSAAAPPGTLDKIRASGTVVLGVADAAAPMTYALGAQRDYTGYHVELCRRVLQEIAPQARLQYLELTAQNTLTLVQNGTVDIVCGAATNNLARQQRVAFSLTTYLSQVRMVVRADSDIHSFAQLAGRTVAATTGTTAVQLLRSYGKAHGIEIPVRLGKDHLDSFLMLEAGRAEAFVLDDNLLAGMVATGRAPQAWRITGEVLAAEPIALVLRKDDPAFKQAVDTVLRRLMLSGEAEQLYERWFMAPIPPRGVRLQLPLSDALRQLFRAPNDLPLETYVR
ncbi:transporter substrate-binding domain-containing protein [Pseudorhodoferax sp.]|uniref:transporter substrate-binding domain-containing protein n=1 Tax=Pseudorhodoferax sp. TaxID=1993553 RepID=UPI002DD6493C|nr:transporter substrate-binding domain-containing protein [Pseudorhodoferax sp.]